MDNAFISVKEASLQSGYSESHIRALLSRGLIAGQKFAHVWMVERESITAHKATMEGLGVKKHGVWASAASDQTPRAAEETC